MDSLLVHLEGVDDEESLCRPIYLIEDPTIIPVNVGPHDDVY